VDIFQELLKIIAAGESVGARGSALKKMRLYVGESTSLRINEASILAYNTHDK
jgi:hypothetical protein